MFIIGILLLSGGLFYLLVFSPIFRLNKINIDGIIGMDPRPIDDIVLSILNKKILFGKIPVNNPLFLPDNEILKEIGAISFRIKNVSVRTEILNHIILVKIDQRQPSAIWCRVLQPELPPAVSLNATTSESKVRSDSMASAAPEAENCFFVDVEGFIYETAPIISGGALPTVYQQSNIDLKVGEEVSNQRMFGFILATKKDLSSININLTDFIVEEQSAGDLEILAPDGWRIYLDTTAQSPDAQISVLKRVLLEEIKDKRSQLDYIDLRVAGRAYFKLKTP